MNTLPDVPAFKKAEPAGTVSAPFRFRVPVAGASDISITFVAAGEEMNVMPPLAFSVPDEILIVVMGGLFVVVVVPVKEIKPLTVAVPASILHAFNTLLMVDRARVTVPVTVRAIPGS